MSFFVHCNKQPLHRTLFVDPTMFIIVAFHCIGLGSLVYEYPTFLAVTHASIPVLEGPPHLDLSQIAQAQPDLQRWIQLTFALTLSLTTMV